MEQKCKDKGEFIDALNEDLASEYRSIVQYVQHLSTVKGVEYQQLLGELRKHLSQELEHAIILAGQIDFLGGVPCSSVPTIETKTDAKQALRQDLALEERQLKRYRQRVEEANDLGLPDVAEALAPLLAQTQDHVQDLRGAVGPGAG